MLQKGGANGAGAAAGAVALALGAGVVMSALAIDLTDAAVASAVLAAGAHFWRTWLSRRKDCWTSFCSFQTTQERLLAHLWRHALLLD